MTGRQHVEKQRLWTERLGRYRTSGLTVARFCARERVSLNTFYRWAKLIGADSPTASSSPQIDATGLRCKSAGRAHAAAETAQPAVVRFHFNAAVEVSVPADCLDAIRCLAQCVQHARAEHGGAFQEVVVATR